MGEGQTGTLSSPAKEPAALRAARLIHDERRAVDDRCPVRQVDRADVATWRALQAEALRAHQAFVSAARGATTARHRGEIERADTLTRLARKQHQRWVELSRRMSSYES